jgi:glycosyltransferase involved in cell wall biosynthesis
VCEVSLKVLHIITGLAVGGAEIMLWRLIQRLECKSLQNEVISLGVGGPIRENLESLRIPVHCVGMRPGRVTPLHVFRLCRFMRRAQADCAQTWMYHSDLLGGLGARMSGNVPVVWGIHNSTFAARGTKLATRGTVRLCAAFSGWLPRRIVCCSEVARTIHEKMGYPSDRMLVIPNGFDVEAFRPDPDAEGRIRAELGISYRNPLVGLFGRFDPQKNHQGFFRAAAIVGAHCPGVHFVLCGDQISWENVELARWIEDAHLRERVHLLGVRFDMPALTAALDVACCASKFGEAFPLVLGEAMACGVPCVTTDVGDSSRLVGDAGKTVPPDDSAHFAQALLEFLCMSKEQRKQIGLHGRERVQTCFSLGAVACRYENLYRQFDKGSRRT